MADLYQPSNSEELSQRFLRDVRLASIQAGNDDVPVGYGSDFWLTSQGLSGMALQGFRNIALSESDQNVLTAEGDALDIIRVGYGIPEVSASPGRGRITIRVSGSATITNGQAFLYPNGKSGRVIGTYVNPSDKSDINVECTTNGTSGNLKSGETVRFIGTPINVTTEALVSTDEPITGGTDTETDARKRLRILNVLRNKPAAGNWSHLRQIVLDENGGVQNCFVYPALGGPASVKVVAVKDFNPADVDFSRSVSDALLSAIRDDLQAKVPIGIQVVVQTAASEYTDITLKLTIPSSSKSGGNGLGWLDIAPWPSLDVADAGKVTVSAVNATFDSFTVSANTTVEPIEGQTHLSWWSAVDRKFHSGLIILKTGTTGAWVVTMDRPLVDSTGAGPATGDYVCPQCKNIDGYGTEWINLFRSLGTGENTATVALLPRASRHPYVADEAPYSVTNASLKAMTQRFNEITDFALGYTLKVTPTVPSLRETPPNILIPRRFAVYPL